MDEKKKLYRVNEGKMIGGVCGGIAEYFNLDVTVVRIGMVLLAVLGGYGIIAYIVALILMPPKAE